MTSSTCLLLTKQDINYCTWNKLLCGWRSPVMTAALCFQQQERVKSLIPFWEIWESYSVLLQYLGNKTDDNMLMLINQGCRPATLGTIFHPLSAQFPKQVNQLNYTMAWVVFSGRTVHQAKGTCVYCLHVDVIWYQLYCKLHPFVLLKITVDDIEWSDHRRVDRVHVLHVIRCIHHVMMMFQRLAYLMCHSNNVNDNEWSDSGRVDCVLSRCIITW